MTRITPKNIRRLRARAGLSQTKLAEKLGWPPKKASMISCWERGVCQPSLIERRQLRELMRSTPVTRALGMVRESRARMNRYSGDQRAKLEAAARKKLAKEGAPKTEMVWHPPLEQQCEALIGAMADIVELADQIKDPEVFRRHARKIADRSRFLSMQCRLTISDAAARKLVRDPKAARS